MSESDIKPTKHLNTAAVLKNSYTSGDKIKIGFETPKIAVEPTVESRYDETFAEDIILLNDRKDTQNIIYDIFSSSPYATKYINIVIDEGDNIENKDNNVKIEKTDIREIFYYIKDELAKRKPLSIFEMVIAINEFFDFNYDYIVKHILTPKIKADLYQEYYDNGMKKRMDMTIIQSLF